MSFRSSREVFSGNLCNPCNGKTPPCISTKYGGKSSATGLTHLQHTTGKRGRCGRGFAENLQAEHTGIQSFEHPIAGIAEISMNYLRKGGKFSLTNKFARQGEFVDSSKSFLQLIKDFFKNLFIFLKKSLMFLSNYFQRELWKIQLENAIESASSFHIHTQLLITYHNPIFSLIQITVALLVYET